MKYVLSIILLALGNNAIAALNSWDGEVSAVRTCKHPSGTATLIQIDFKNVTNTNGTPEGNKSLVLADNDYSSTLFSHYMSTALTAYSTKKRLEVHDGYAYAHNYCGLGNSTHSGAQVDMRIHD